MIGRLKLILLEIRYSFTLRRKEALYNLLKHLDILSSRDSIKYILENKCSVSRFGDGEFMVMGGHSNGFQRENKKLAIRLSEVMLCPVPNHVVGIPSSLRNRTKFKINSRLFILGYLVLHGENDLLPYINPKRKYLDSLFTRFYMPYKKVIYGDDYIESLKKIWDSKDILIVEGRYSRLGVGNDLFSNTISTIRIIAPEKNAFDSYDRILEQIRIYGKNRLVLIALGMTATVLAYDLAKEGFQAIDIGHVDVEYMWYKIRAKSKCNIPGRYVNECGGIQEELDESILKDYRNQIVCEVCSYE